MARILLVDDDKDLANLTKLALMKEGYEVVVFHTALKAIEEARVRKPDLVLMDIMMPEMNGADAVKEFQKDPFLKNIPIIFLTGLVSNQDNDLEKNSINVEGVLYKTLGKPYEIDDLFNLVRKSL